MRAARLLLLALAACAAPRPLPTPAAATQRFDEVLPSGLRLVVEEVRGTGEVAVITVLSAGSALDPPGKTGLAHLVEHLTVFRDREGGVDALQALFALGGAQTRGRTETAWAQYRTTAPRAALSALIAHQARRFTRPLASLDPVALEVEKTVLHAEAQRMPWIGDPLTDLLLPGDSRLPRVPEQLDGISLDDVQRFAAEHYRPSNVTLLVAGDFDAAAAHAEILSALPDAVVRAPGTRRPPPAFAPLPELPPPPAELPVVSLPVPQPTLVVAWTMPDDHLEAWFFEKLAVRLRSLGHGIDVFTNTYGNVALVVAMLPRDERPPSQQLAAVADAVSLAVGGESAAEVRWRFELFRGSALDAWEDQATVRAVRLHAGLGESLDLAEAERRYAAAARWLAPRRVRGLVIVPGPAPQRPVLVTPAEGAHLPAPAPPAAAVSSLAAVPDLEGLRTGTLSNGLRVVVVPRPWAPRVAVTLSRLGGDHSGRPGVDLLLDAALYLEQETRWDGPCRRLSLYTHRAPAVTDLSLRPENDQLDCALGELARLATSPPPKVTPEMVAEAAVRNRPTTEEDRAVWRGALDHRSAGEAQLRAITGDELAAHHRAVFEPSRVALVIVGDVDAERALASAEHALRGWRGSGAPPPRLVGPLRLDTDPALPRATLHARGAGLANLKLRCLQAPSQRAASLVVLALLSQHSEALRARFGMSYHSGTDSARSPAADWVENSVDVLRQALATRLRELHAALRAEPGDEAIARARWRAATALHARERASSVSVGAWLGEQLVAGGSLEQLRRQNAAVGAVTTAEVRAAWKTCRETAHWSLSGELAEIRALAAEVLGAAALTGASEQ